MLYSKPDPIMLSFTPVNVIFHLQVDVLFISFHSLVYAFILLKKQLTCM